MPRTNVVVVTRAQRCHYCDIGYYSMGHVLSEAPRGLEITDLGGDLATREQLEATIAEKDPILVLGFGHGDSNTFTGQDALPVLTGCINDGIMAGRIVILHSCLTAQLLGPSIISKGGLAYIGSYETWTWVDLDGSGDPYADPYAKCFFESANQIPIALLNGRTVGEATALGLERYDYWIDWWGRSTDSNAPEIIKWLIWDRENTRQLGLAEASATTVVQIPLEAASPALTTLSLLVGALAGSIPDKRRNQLVAFTLGTLGTLGLGIYIKKKSAPAQAARR